MLLIILCSWKLWLLPLTLLTTCVVTTPVDTAKLFHVVQTLRSNRVIRRQADSTPFPIRGVDTVGVYPRLEVRQLEQNPDQWNLYMLGLTAMQSVNQTDELSWYQIAGIHGVPFTSWNGVQMALGGGGGYCVHSSNIFPTWHRPYLALYEEILYAHIQNIAAGFPAGPVRDRYTAAASTFRIPYWDWAVSPPDGQTLPSSLQRTTVDVVMSNGTATIPNPLYTYRFHPLVPSDMFQPSAPQMAVYPSTLRYPSDTTAKAVSRDLLASDQLNQFRPNVQSRLYNLFSMISDYAIASNDISNDESIESIHDTIHNTVGGNNGHMTDIPYAAFDPVFWLHHAMVDRVFAIWQVLNPGSWVEPMELYSATYAIPAGTTIDGDFPLYPFHSASSGDFWTSNDVKATTTFGYTYPELQQSGNLTAAISSAINSLYGPNSGKTIGRSNTSATKRDVESKANQFRKRAIAGAPSFVLGRAYQADISVKKFGLGGSFTIYIFLGEPTTKPSDWSSDPNFVGINGVFSMAMPAAGNSDLMVHGVVPLTAALEDAVNCGEIPDLSEPVVVPYLKEKLVWKIQKMDTTEVPAAQVPGLNISVSTTEVRPALHNSELPQRIGGPTYLSDITTGKAGGCS